ncbi:MAG: type II secretion system GspH family protein [Endomicrobia bacterium]|nr:type II secretion system GspH family protein [Endomicrobiia bacterium]MCL2799573.1 type II secretion system GspH family protein [Endomicrobiia bacterium]
MNIKKNNLGVSMIELVVGLVIVIIMVGVFAVGSKRMQLRNAYKNEARAVIQDIVNKQRIYFAQSGRYIKTMADLEDPQYDKRLGVDLRRNSYFNKFTSLSVGGPNNINPQITVEVTGPGGNAKGVYTRDTDIVYTFS